MTLAELFIVIKGNAAPMHATIKGVHSALGGLSSAVHSVMPLLLGGSAAAGAAMAYGLYRAVGAASDLNEAMDSARSTFGSAFDQLNADVEAMNKRFGLSRKTLIEMADGFGAIAQGAGMGERASAGFASTFNKLAADLASKKNLSLEDAGLKLRSALAGEMEPLRRFGVVIDEDKVKAYAYAHGLAKVGQQLDANTKFQARAALIQEQLAKVSGDLERTEGSAANQSRKMWGQISTLTEQVGTALLPAYQSVLSIVNELLGTMSKDIGARLAANMGWIQEQTKGFALRLYDAVVAIKAFGQSETAAAMLRGLGDLFGWVGRQALALIEGVEFVAYHIDDMMALMVIGVQELGMNWDVGFRFIGQNAANFAGWMTRNWSNMLKDMINIAVTGLANLTTNFANFGAALVKFLANPAGGFKFEPTALLKGMGEMFSEKLPEIAIPAWRKLEGERDVITKHMSERELKRLEDRRKREKSLNQEAGGTEAAPAGTPGATAAAPIKAAEKAFSGDPASWAKQIQDNAFGGKDHAKQTADNTGRTNRLLEQAIQQGQGNGWRPPQPALAS